VALFSRRALQRVLNENAAFLTPKQLLDACNSLNSIHDNYLAVEWEQVVLNAFSRVGVVKYEPTFEGTRKPDFEFRLPEQSLEFIADVTTVSDKGLERENPVHAVNAEFLRQLRKRQRDSSLGGFNVRVDSQTSRIYRGSPNKVKLKLPRQSEFPKKIFNHKFREFLDAISAAPSQNHEYHAIDVDTGVHFVYDPALKGRITGGHQSFTITNQLDHNPVYNALKAKGDQLKEAGYRGLRGVILCDGGCHILQSTRPSWAEYSINDVIAHFFRQYDSVQFAVTLLVRSGSRNSEQYIEIESTLYVSPKWTVDAKPLKAVIDRVCRLLPKPVEIPANALSQLKFHNGLSGRYWGKLVEGGAVKISSRTFLEILAGTKTLEEFERDYKMNPGKNPFRRKLESGRLISKVTVEHLPEKDDDVVTVEFGNVDPAISRFRVP
jgi:hypothetical protein